MILAVGLVVAVLVALPLAGVWLVQRAAERVVMRGLGW